MKRCLLYYVITEKFNIDGGTPEAALETPYGSFKRWMPSSSHFSVYIYTYISCALKHYIYANDPAGNELRSNFDFNVVIEGILLCVLRLLFRRIIIIIIIQVLFNRINPATLSFSFIREYYIK